MMLFKKPKPSCQSYGILNSLTGLDDETYNITSRRHIVKKPVINPHARIEFYESINRQQSFPFQNPLINYIAKNPATPKVYQKLYKSCKYFFDKNPILVVAKLTFKYNTSGWHICWDEIDIDSRNISSKFWITKEIEIVNDTENCDNQHLVNDNFPKIYQVDIRKFSLINQSITLNNLMSLATKCENIYLKNVTVKNDDNSIVSLEEVVENLPNVKTFQYEIPYTTSYIITSKTVNNLLKITHFSNLEEFNLYELPEIFDLERFCDHIKQDDNTHFFISFRSQISEELKNRIIVIKEEIYNAEYRGKSTFIISR